MRFDAAADNNAHENVAKVLYQDPRGEGEEGRRGRGVSP